MKCEVGQAYQVGESMCHVPNVCCVCNALLPMGTTVSVKYVLGDNRYRNRIDAYCDRCATGRRPSILSLDTNEEESQE